MRGFAEAAVGPDPGVIDPFAPPRSAYVHVPFCLQRCGYCDFTLIAQRDDLFGTYLDALEVDLARLCDPRPMTTLFVGGGTPTHLDVTSLQRLMELLRRWLPVETNGEFSVEANPDGLTDDKLDLLADSGVNRISLGVQSFDTRELSVLERTHTPDEAFRVIEQVRSRWSNASLDLIFGLPGQSLDDWSRNLDRAIATGVPHISAYGLTIERGTTFWSRREKGTLHTGGEDLEREMYALAMDRLPAAGLDQYELSNYARPGFGCRHNQVYWAGGPYYGFGPGAAWYVDGERALNHRSTTTWIRGTLRGERPLLGSERLNPEERARETLVIGLRRTAGVDRGEFARQTGIELDSLLAKEGPLLRELGLIEQTAAGVRLTCEGRFVADTIVGRLL
jgi:oxygen-independent coproporphyrinogen III oxidase